MSLCHTFTRLEYGNYVAHVRTSHPYSDHANVGFYKDIERSCQLEVVLVICVGLTFAADIVERSRWVRWKAGNLNPKVIYGVCFGGSFKGG